MPLVRVFLVLTLVLSGAAKAETLTFDDIDDYEVGNFFDEDGYRVEGVGGGLFGGFTDDVIHFDIFGGPFNDAHRLSRIDGERFSLKGADVLPLGEIFLLQNTSAQANVTFAGIRNGSIVSLASTTTQDGTVKTLNFGNILDNVDEVLITGFLAGNEDLFFTGGDIHFDIDNLIVERFGGQVTAVPLPASGLLLIGGLAAVAGISRKRRRAA